MTSPTSRKKVPRPESARPPGPSTAGRPPDGPPPPQLADLTDVETIYAPKVKTTRLRTIHIQHNPTSTAPSSAPHAPGPEDPAALTKALFARLDADQEHFIILTCNAQHRPYGFKHIASGGNRELLIDPAIVFRAALLLGAAHIIVAHNHPSGDPTPSIEDLRLTTRLLTFGHLINIPVLDHLILAHPGHALSLRTHHLHLWP